MDAETLELIDLRIKEAVDKAIKEERARLAKIIHSADKHSGRGDFSDSFDSTMRKIASDIDPELY